MNQKALAFTDLLMERRAAHASPVADELTLESSWRPSDRAPVAAERWLRENGYAPDRRARRANPSAL